MTNVSSYSAYCTVSDDNPSPKLKGFGLMRWNEVVYHTAGHRVTDADILTVDFWVSNHSHGGGGFWDAEEFIENVVPYIDGYSGEEFLGWFAALGYLDAKSGFVSLGTQEEEAKREVGEVVDALSKIGWKTAYHVFYLTSQNAHLIDVEHSEAHYYDWFIESAKMVDSKGLQYLGEYSELITSGITSDVIIAAIDAGMDEDLIESMMVGAE